MAISIGSDYILDVLNNADPAKRAAATSKLAGEDVAKLWDSFSTGVSANSSVHFKSTPGNAAPVPSGVSDWLSGIFSGIAGLPDKIVGTTESAVTSAGQKALDGLLAIPGNTDKAVSEATGIPEGPVSASWIGQYFTRGALFILGAIFVAAGLFMLGRRN